MDLPRPSTSTEDAEVGTAEPEDPATPDDIVDEWGLESFPASDPPANY